MDQKHRDHINKNIDILLDYTEYKSLMDRCVEHNLLSTEMRKNIEQDVSLNDKSEADKETEKHKNLFHKITKRGPTAYQQLKKILIDLGMLGAERILSDYKDAKFISVSHKQHPVNNNTPYDIEKKLPANDIAQRIIGETNNNGNDQQDSRNNGKLRVIKSKSLEDESEKVYKMVSKKRGVLFMVNNIKFEIETYERHGADNDHKVLHDVFTQLYFKIYSYKDLRRDDFVKELRQVLLSTESRDSDCFVLILMTHGTLDSHNSPRVQFYDTDMKLQEIYNLFDEGCNTDLKKKPKVFLFPFCRGPHIEKKGVIEETEGVATVRFGRGLKDTLVCYASSPGYSAHRDVDGGNWYIQDFCKVLSQHAHNTDLESMIKKVQEHVNNKETKDGDKQICCYENRSFNRQLYFNPGLYKDEQNTTREFEEILDNEVILQDDLQMSRDDESNHLRKRQVPVEIDETVKGACSNNSNNGNDLRTKDDEDNKENKVKIDII